MNWIECLEHYGIEYATRGPNTKRGEVSVRCPWCADEDPSQHLGISLTEELWGCHRDATHRGKSSTRLISALLSVSTSQARLIYTQFSHSDPDGLDSALAWLTGEAPITHEQPHKPPQMPAECAKPIRPQGTTSRFWAYLRARGFDDPQALITAYNLTCCETGRYKNRVIIPYVTNQKLVGWTGRVIGVPTMAPRYLTSSEAVKATFLNADGLREGGRLLILTEGPFDALKLDFYARPYGVRATCSSGVSLTVDQAITINDLCQGFEQVCVLFDTNASGPAFQAADWVISRRAYVGHLPDGVKDPGDFTPAQAAAFANSQIAG